MTAEDVLELHALFAQHGIAVCIDGGWGIDALLGHQTRPHADLDIAIQHNDVPRLRELLEQRGYMDVPRPDTRDCNFVLGGIDGQPVQCIALTWVIKFRENYEPDEGDVADVQLLYDTCGMPLPRNYTGRIRT